MSYDLFLKPSDPTFTYRDFIAYFEGRTNYSITESQVWYQNEDTGVYFVFEDNSKTDEQDEEDPAAGFPILFNMNYFRPSYFAAEAEPELTATVEHFAMSVFDPQFDGMETDKYDPAGFLSGWNKGNEAGYASFLKNQQACRSLPSTQLERIWRWNLERNKLQERLGEGVFVPRIMFMEADGDLSAAVLWPDGIPTALFPGGAVIAFRDELAPRRFFRKQTTTNLVPWSDVKSLVDENFSETNGAYVPNYDRRPDAITEYFLKLKPESREISQVPADQVLNRELVEKHMA